MEPGVYFRLQLCGITGHKQFASDCGLLLTPAETLPVAAAITGGSLLFFAGMAASIFHLGQTLKAWRFFLGLKTSWLSREILAFSLFAPLPFLLCVLPLLPDFPFKSLASHVTALAMLGNFIAHPSPSAAWLFALVSASKTLPELAFLAIPAALVSPWLALPILLLAEVHERLLFFQSVRAPKMPGNFGPENAH